MIRFATFAAAIALVLLSGCGTADVGPKATGSGRAKAAVEPWPKFVAGLRDKTDPKGVRQLLVELNADLAVNPTADQPKKSSEADLAALAAELKLSKDDVAFLVPAEFAPLDAHHIADAIFFRSCGQAMGLLPTDPAAFRAGIAFEWVCRQMPLAATNAPAAPPSFAATRGHGTGFERATVLIALLRQLGLDSFLIGNGAAERSANYGSDGQGPFWAVGVRDGDDLLLYDPWRGEAVPGSKPDRPITFAELKANPEKHPWIAGAEKLWRATANDVKTAEVYVTAPLSSLAPRMQALNEKIAADHGLELAVDWASLKSSAKDAAGGSTVVAWNPLAEFSTPLRVLANFLPKSEGGRAIDQEDISPPIAQFYYSQLPRTISQSLPKDLPPALRSRTLNEAVAMFGTLYVTPPSPRQKVVRGSWREATKDLVDRRDRFAKAADRLAAGGSRQSPTLKSWILIFEQAAQRLKEAELIERRSDLPEATAEMQKVQRQTPASYGDFLDEVVSGAGLAEANALLAAAAHERAEAAEVAARRAELAANDRAKQDTAKAARTVAAKEWVTASAAWQRAMESIDAADRDFPGRKAHVEKCLARAERLAAAK